MAIVIKQAKRNRALAPPSMPQKCGRGERITHRDGAIVVKVPNGVFDTANRVTSGRAPTVDEAKVRFLASWQKVAGTRIPSRGDL
jgi:hypothetical protein